MLREVIPMLLLTLLFTVTSLSVLLLRKRLRGGIGSMMYLIWLCVLVMAILPLRLGAPSLHFWMQEPDDTSAPFVDMRMEQSELLIITRADDIPTQNEQRQTLTDYANENNSLIGHVKGAIGISIPVMLVYAANLLGVVWAVGFGYKLVAEYIEYRRLRAVFDRCSSVCTDARIHEIFAECRQKAGISPKREITFRMIDETCHFTPCVMGVFHPTVYVSAFCGTLDAPRLTHVLLHELCHIRRHDLLYKYFSVFVLSFHWICPTTRYVREAISEDIELACDASVLRLTGDLSGYMESILSVAAYVVTTGRMMQENGIRHADTAGFMASNTAPSYLKRRYLHMKTTREKKHAKKLYTLCAGVLALIVGANAALLSSCGFIEASTAGGAADGAADAEISYTYDPIDTALRNYFNIPETAEITAEMYGEIDTIDFYILKATDETAAAEQIVYQTHLDAVFVSVNGANVEHLMPNVLTKAAMESVVLPALDAYDAAVNAVAAQKFRAFYALKDPSDPVLEPRAVAEMYLLFPELEEYGPLYIFDPYTTQREDDHLYQTICDAGIVDTSMLNEAALTAKVAVNSGLADVEVRYYTASGIDGFDVDSDVFGIRSENQRGVSAEREVMRQSMNAENNGLDIDGDGVIETSND